MRNKSRRDDCGWRHGNRTNVFAQSVFIAMFKGVDLIYELARGRAADAYRQAT